MTVEIRRLRHRAHARWQPGQHRGGGRAERYWSLGATVGARRARARICDAEASGHTPSTGYVRLEIPTACA